LYALESKSVTFGLTYTLEKKLQQPNWKNLGNFRFWLVLCPPMRTTTRLRGPFSGLFWAFSPGDYEQKPPHETTAGPNAAFISHVLHQKTGKTIGFSPRPRNAADTP
jgi:hypothetical protein